MIWGVYRRALNQLPPKSRSTVSWDWAVVRRPSSCIAGNPASPRIARTSAIRGFCVGKASLSLSELLGRIAHTPKERGTVRLGANGGGSHASRSLLSVCCTGGAGVSGLGRGRHYCYEPCLRGRVRLDFDERTSTNCGSNQQLGFHLVHQFDLLHGWRYDFSPNHAAHADAGPDVGRLVVEQSGSPGHRGSNGGPADRRLLPEQLLLHGRRLHELGRLRR